jgi:hypothetical protein
MSVTPHWILPIVKDHEEIKKKDEQIENNLQSILERLDCVNKENSAINIELIKSNELFEVLTNKVKILEARKPGYQKIPTDIWLRNILPFMGGNEQVNDLLKRVQKLEEPKQKEDTIDLKVLQKGNCDMSRTIQALEKRLDALEKKPVNVNVTTSNSGSSGGDWFSSSMPSVNVSTNTSLGDFLREFKLYLRDICNMRQMWYRVSNGQGSYNNYYPHQACSFSGNPMQFYDDLVYCMCRPHNIDNRSIQAVNLGLKTTSEWFLQYYIINKDISIELLTNVMPYNTLLAYITAYININT